MIDHSLFPPIAPDALLSLLHGAERIVLTTHANPDGDAIGSEYALAHYLLGVQKQVRIINTDPLPENLGFLNSQRLFEEFDAATHTSIIEAADLLVFLDLNAPGRVKRMEAAVLHSRAMKIVIDHHLDPKPFADWHHIRHEACATAEIIYGILHTIPGFVMTRDIALGLYTGIMTDTGSFRFDSTTPAVHRIAAELLSCGVAPQIVYKNIYDEYPFPRTRLLGRILADIELLCNGRASILTATRELFTETGTTLADTENIVNYGLSIRGISVTAFLAETDDGIKISFRSRGETIVNEIAKQFGGGGHSLASGTTLSGVSFDDAIGRVRDALCRLFT
jgi:bifunctional oligoribonuclease and PAP phosphatase NrnA